MRTYHKQGEAQPKVSTNFFLPLRNIIQLCLAKFQFTVFWTFGCDSFLCPSLLMLNNFQYLDFACIYKSSYVIMKITT